MSITGLTPTMGERPFGGRTLVIICVFLVASVDFARDLQFGGLTALGLLTILSAVLLLAVLPFSLLYESGAAVPTPLWLFLIYVVISTTLTPISAVSIQNASAYIVFVGTVAVAAATPFDPATVLRLLRAGARVSVCLYGGTVLLFGLGNNALFDARAFALTSILGLALLLPGRRGRYYEWVEPFLVVVLVAASYSRTVTGVSVMLLVFLCFRFARGSRATVAIVMIVLSAVGSFWAVNYYEPIRERFTEVGDNASFGGVQVNTSGRLEFWKAVWESARESLFMGKGTGSANQLIVERFGAGIGHPHNDYLRFVHDFGLMGLFLWLLSMTFLAIRLILNYRAAEEVVAKSLQLSGLIGILGLSAAMITDNVAVYVFVMAPFALIVGMCLREGRRPTQLSPAAGDVEARSFITAPGSGTLG